MNRKSIFAALALLAALGLSSARVSADGTELHFERNHFTPQSLAVSAGQPLALRVVNASTETIEFESFKLNRERVIPPGASITVRLPPLRPGSYDFFDDFHHDVPEGALIAK